MAGKRERGKEKALPSPLKYRQMTVEEGEGNVAHFSF